MESQYGTTITEIKVNNWFNSTNEAISNEAIDDLVRWRDIVVVGQFGWADCLTVTRLLNMRKQI
uniref:Uncharacterized protein n=1 Tax=Romanomermis culicivorax TaxID=13658 RepID=A0A915KW11_ROMCU